MSLQEEIAKDLFDFETNGKIYTIAAKDIISKVLDAVDRKIDAEGGEFGPSDDLEKGYDDGLAAALKAVKQLRDES